MRLRLTRAVAGTGLVLVAAAVTATQSSLDRHFLPSFFVPRDWYVAIESAVRIAIAAAGLTLVFTRGRLVGLLMRAPFVTVQVVAAAVLGIAAGAMTIDKISLRPTEWLVADEEPRRQEDTQLGWVLAPHRVGHAIVGGRPIAYGIDSNGYRVHRVDDPVDPERPTIVFGGESVIFGEGLTWEESIPARVGTLVGVQAANLAVHGYSTDQIYLRLSRELPRFRRPVAVVTIFMTELFGRNLDDDRPHLSPGLQWMPAERTSRAMSLAGLLVPYRRTATVDQGIRMTRAVLRAMAQLARDHGAIPLVIIPRFGAEDAVQATLRSRVLTEDVPALVVPLDSGWRLPGDRHPNARAAGVIASAIAARLK